MADAQETVADIIAEMRECAEAADPAIWNDGRIAGLVGKEKRQQLDYCRRLEAAHERELAAARREPRTWGECVAEYQKRKEAGEYGPY